MAKIMSVLVLLLTLSVIPAWSKSINLPSPQCHPSVIDTMPQRVKKICEALSTIWEFSDAMNNYLDEKGKSRKIDYFNDCCPALMKIDYGKILNHSTNQKMTLIYDILKKSTILITWGNNFLLNSHPGFWQHKMLNVVK